MVGVALGFPANGSVTKLVATGSNEPRICLGTGNRNGKGNGIGVSRNHMRDISIRA